MSNPFGKLLLLAAVAGGALAVAAGPAAAQSYPRVVGTGENMTVDYGPMAQGNLVGGGRVMVTEPTGMGDIRVMHLDSVFAQQPREGFVPVVIGMGQNMTTIYVPQAMAERMARAGTGR
ncbi:hypothetical protein DFH01_18815 [Falsiroseomonas bella]|uniref:Uncharacterized protein n=1 Tax=Falsiroseomonas bella TaxID=2184016 RepID=A0A317FDM0_9PROT|nr:hypothetical protein [Falsiroseomonas bella]PWS35646.1 hypothetical protein DFH01_18815 [Falsiroseomonas bella]